MTPNLFLATQTLFSPHKWFKAGPKSERPSRRTEHWNDPVPGVYEYIPGRGWYLVATDRERENNTSKRHDTGNRTPHEGTGPDNEDEDEYAVDLPALLQENKVIPMIPPTPVKYSKVLKRYLLAPDYEARKRHGQYLEMNPAQHGANKLLTAGFFRLDDGIAWVKCWDQHGEFIPGPYKLWCVDRETGLFRHMLRGDDPKYAASRSRGSSIDGGDEGGRKRRTSQDSRSTQFKGGSGAGTRASSIRGLTPSAPASRPGSRRGSPKRSPSVPLEEAKERLRKLAEEQKSASASAATRFLLTSYDIGVPFPVTAARFHRFARLRC
ncbi:uncharacterized protein EI97DRAFT_450257 [Westerdykella ornata]|uniref:Uncharacterized protein n=1 Tax=Westerdykella ornata TaxID=318751 RepID=A0A6A6JKC8_WESOR|nr:uncharacterized protein EI97DRAFT_450257 [Westerdykella ornata]KAF2276418.1 hypothetical protein EI97DRAFT_450257 [Westerdykella ornata]